MEQQFVPQLQKAGAGCSCVTPTESKVEEERFPPTKSSIPSAGAAVLGWPVRCVQPHPWGPAHPAGTRGWEAGRAGTVKRGDFGQQSSSSARAWLRTVNPLEERLWLPQLCE